MIYGSFIYRSAKKNNIFKAGNEHSPYKVLRKKFLDVGIELNTPDLNKGKEITFEFHLNAQRKKPSTRAYVHLAENPLIRPLNRDQKFLIRYAKWFTWDNELCNNEKARHLLLPNCLEFGLFNPPEDRPIFLVLVAANKALRAKDFRDQYQLRQVIINWYEKNAPAAFYLYGKGWNLPFALPGIKSKLIKIFLKFISAFYSKKPKLKTWHGLVQNKIELLKSARFCIAHENCRDLPGYITEKLFDCFRAGCVPVYIGPEEINVYVPSNCFIDGRQFKNPAEMNAHLHSISDDTYKEYQKNIHNFMTSERAKIFSSEYFAEAVVRTILTDLSNI